MATEIISSGVVSSGGSYYNKNTEIYGTASDFIFDYCSSVTVMLGGKTIDTTLGNSSYMKVQSGGIASRTTVKSATMIVSNGGSADTVTFTGSYPGIVRVEGIATNVSGNGSMTIASNGTASKATMTNFVNVSNGGLAIDTTMDLAGHMLVNLGGSASKTTLLSSAHLSLSGAALSTYLEGDNASMFVLDGAAASNTHISGGSARVYVSNGGSVQATYISGGAMIVSEGAVASKTYVSSGGSMSVSSGGTASYVDASSGGVVILHGGADVSALHFLGGIVRLTGGFRLSDAAIQAGSLNVQSDSLAVNVGIRSSGVLNIHSGGGASSCTVISGGQINLYGGVAVKTSVMDGGALVIEDDGLHGPQLIGPTPVSAGAASATHVELGGIVTVGSGGFAANTVLAYSSSGGLNPLTPEKPGKTSGLIPIAKRASMSVIQGGSAVGVLASSGGFLAVGSGGTVISATIQNGARVRILEGGVLNDLSIANGASASILGSTSKLAVGGIVELGSGGSLADVTVESGGVLRAQAGSLVSAVTVSSGGKLTGRYANVPELSIALYEGSILDFDITSLGENEVCIENTNYGGIYTTGSISCTLTVSGSQANGIYQLTNGISGYIDTIEVLNTDGDSLGTLTVDGTTKIGNSSYTLTKGSLGTLTVTIEAAAPEPVVIPPYLTGDFNGDLFDTLASQKDGEVTIYQNGEPWGIGITLDPGWNVLGTGDFNGDHLDDFLRVNDEGYVVGELSNGNGTFTPQVLNLKNSGWDILGTGDFNGNGSDDVLIANPTGASETVGLLGYWESGVTWTLINGYSPEWECVSTGDFNGDGKCDMLWKNQFVGDGDLVYNAYCTWIVEDPVDWRMVSVANPDEWNFLCSGDFDGNGSHDIAMINDVGVVGIWGVTDGYLSSWSILSAVTSEWQLAGVADFNADGTDDIAWSNTATGLTGYWQINDKQLTTWANIAVIG
ncbi:MAG: hypothetical protein J6Y92_04965 [Lentisphaeria bacterium]|nr:hypothetical protein [Lentisphaeria bacterium]